MLHASHSGISVRIHAALFWSAICQCTPSVLSAGSAPRCVGSPLYPPATARALPPTQTVTIRRIMAPCVRQVVPEAVEAPAIGTETKSATTLGRLLTTVKGLTPWPKSAAAGDKAGPATETWTATSSSASPTSPDSVTQWSSDGTARTDDAGRGNAGAGADRPPVLEPAAVGLRRVPHALSLLDCAAASGDGPTVRHVLEVYRQGAPQCLRWEHHVGHGLWAPYAAAAQDQIAQALARGDARVVLEGAAGAGALCFRTMRRARPDGGAAPVRARLRQQLHCDGPAGHVVTSAVGAVAWDSAFVVAVPQAGVGTASEETLRLLAQEGAVDPSLWLPACKQPAALAWGPGPPPGRLEAVLRALVAAAVDIPAHLLLPLAPRERRRGSRGRREKRRAAEQSRFTDGLAAPSSGGATRSSFYAAEYRTEEGTLEFCMALPENDVGLRFEAGPLGAMAQDCVLKVHELQRQRVVLSPVYVVPIYVYTYELTYEADAGGDQIYGAMNRAMRTHDAAAVAFWRPLIWQVSGRFP